MNFSNFVRIGVKGLRHEVKINETTTIVKVIPLPSDSKLAEIIAGAVGFSYEVIPTADGSGHLLPNGTWTGLLGMVQSKEVDISLGIVGLSEERSVFDFSYPQLYSEITFATRKPEYVPDALAILRPFSIQMWIAVVLCLCTMCFLFRVMMSEKHSSMTLIMFAMRTFLKQGTKVRPKGLQEFFLVSFWFLGISLVGYIYSAVVLSFLTFPSLTGIKTIEDLVDGIRMGKYQTATLAGAYYSSVFLQSNDESFKTIARNLQLNEKQSDFVAALEDMAMTDKKLAFILIKVKLMPFKDFYFISEDRFGFAYCGFPMSKDFCCKSKLNEVIHRFWSAGIFVKHNSDSEFKVFLGNLRKLTPPKQQNDSGEKLRLDDLKGAFIFIIASHLCAILVLLIEIYFGKFKN